MENLGGERFYAEIKQMLQADWLNCPTQRLIKRATDRLSMLDWLTDDGCLLSHLLV